MVNTLLIWGLNFVEVRGKGYAPFIRFAESLHIPWVIFSDADQGARSEVNSQLSKAKITNKNLDDFVVFLDNSNNFEQQLLAEGFQDQIKKAYQSISLEDCQNEQHKTQKRKEIENKEYNDQELFDIMEKDKIRMGYEVAKEIIKGEKFPTKIEGLFNKIKVRYEG